MNVLVTGGRNFADYQTVENAMDSLLLKYPTLELIHGGASGADALADRWAKKRLVPCEVFPADWKKHGRAAGPIRNQEMLDQHPQIVVAFPGGRGTQDMILRAKRAKITVIIVDDDFTLRKATQ